MPYISFEKVSFHAGGRIVLDAFELGIERGETLVLLGRSGSGKTTALRLANRLLEPASGRILFDGQNISKTDPITLRRQIGYVIQEFGLFPHWTIEENVALTLRLLGWPLPKQQERTRELLEQVGLGYEHTRFRKPHELSGGQRQRVAVARALAAYPRLLLFDEPFGALDPVTRHEMQQQFLALKKRYEVTSIFVTHDLIEALAIGNRIAVLDSGRLEVVTTPQDFFKVKTATARSFLDTLPPEMMKARGVRGQGTR